jgi:predicted ArsR family transcriptional regulator
MALRRRTRRSEAAASPDTWPALSVLSEPRRREVYDFIAMQERPASRDDVVEGLGMTRSLAAFHLEKLVDAGLLETSFRRSPDRAPGPGAGRPSKLYAVSDRKLDLSLPPRRYDLAGRIMARAIAASAARRTESAAALAMRIAEEEGREVGAAHAASGRPSSSRTLAAAEDALAACGYEPTLDGSSVRLRNCPFHSLVEVAPRLVCELNESFVSGMLDGIGGDGTVEAELCGPVDGDCCVVVHTKARARRGD